jgi:transcriptional regulator with XRE-family HTH domain
MTDVLISGLTLKLERVSQNVKATELAARMGVSRPYLSQVESRWSVDPKMAVRYREALATFPSLASPADPPQAA